MKGRIIFHHLCLREERNERLVSGRLKEELQRVAIVCDPLQRTDNRVK